MNFKPYKIGISMPGFDGLLAYWVEEEFPGGILISNRAKGIWNSTARLRYTTNSQTWVSNTAGQTIEIKWSDKARIQGIERAKQRLGQ